MTSYSGAPCRQVVFSSAFLQMFPEWKLQSCKSVVEMSFITRRVKMFPTLERKVPPLVLLVRASLPAAAEESRAEAARQTRASVGRVHSRDASGEISKLRQCCLTFRPEREESGRKAPGGCIREAEFRLQTGCGLTVRSRTSDLRRFLTPSQ